MNYKLKLLSVLMLLFIISSCSQSGNTQTETDKLIGKWKTTDSTSFRGKEVEFFPDHQVTLILAGGGRQSGQYEVKDSIITFSIGDAPPFKMYFRFEDDKLVLTSTQNVVTTYEKNE